MKTIDQWKKRVRTMGLTMTTAFYMLMNHVTIAYAESEKTGTSVKDSKLATGTEKLIKDLTAWLMVLAPIVAGLLIIYFCIRRSAADEIDTKKWNNRIAVAVVSCIGAVLGSATLNIVIGYYS